MRQYLPEAEIGIFGKPERKPLVHLFTIEAGGHKEQDIDNQ
jgi:hypothetical protein